LTSGHSDAHSWASECPDDKNYKWPLHPVWHRCFTAVSIWQQWASKGLIAWAKVEMTLFDKSKHKYKYKYKKLLEEGTSAEQHGRLHHSWNYHFNDGRKTVEGHVHRMIASSPMSSTNRHRLLTDSLGSDDCSHTVKVSKEGSVLWSGSTHALYRRAYITAVYVWQRRVSFGRVRRMTQRGQK